MTRDYGELGAAVKIILDSCEGDHVKVGQSIEKLVRGFRVSQPLRDRMSSLAPKIDSLLMGRATRELAERVVADSQEEHGGLFLGPEYRRIRRMAGLYVIMHELRLSVIS